MRVAGLPARACVLATSTREGGTGALAVLVARPEKCGVHRGRRASGEAGMSKQLVVGGGPASRARRKALAARPDRSEYVVWDERPVAMRVRADECASVVGYVQPGEIVACVQRVGVDPACWMYIHRLRRLSPHATRSGWVLESSRPGLRSLDKLSTKERTTPGVIGDPKLLREATPYRSWHAVEQRIAALEADALHRGGCHSAAQAPARDVATGAAEAAASVSLHRVHAEHHKQSARAQQRQRLARGALSIASGRSPPSTSYWRQHAGALKECSLVDPATVRQLHTQASTTPPGASESAGVAVTMDAQGVPPMLQRLLQVR